MSLLAAPLIVRSWVMKCAYPAEIVVSGGEMSIISAIFGRSNHT